MKNLLLSLMLMLSLACYSQKYNGDWKGSFISSYSNNEVEVIFHIVDNECSEEPSVRSPSMPRENKMNISEDEETVSIYNNSPKQELVFKGKLEKGKLKGTYYVSGKSYNLSMTKFGKGKVSLEKSYKIEEGSGLVFY